MVAPVAMATAAAHPHNSFHSPPHGLFLANHFPRLEIDNRVSVISFHGDLSFFVLFCRLTHSFHLSFLFFLENLPLCFSVDVNSKKTKWRGDDTTASHQQYEDV